MLACWIDGAPVGGGKPAVTTEDRGLQYGHGLFETLLLRRGRIRFLEDHLSRLEMGCRHLGIPIRKPLGDELEQLASTHREGIVKVLLTRGAGGRGYRAAADLHPTCIVSLYAAPESLSGAGIAVRWCTTRLGRNAGLAGMKHLNRLEQVLAQAEWSGGDIAEGLMLDTEGELISATSSNVFLVVDGLLLTPDLRYAGVQGVMRKNVLRAAARLGLACEERAVWPSEVNSAAELFVTNAVRGVRAVHELEQQSWDTGPVTRALTAELGLV